MQYQMFHRFLRDWMRLASNAWPSETPHRFETESVSTAGK
jgi:hypothetical protein